MTQKLDETNFEEKNNFKTLARILFLTLVFCLSLPNICKAEEIKKYTASDFVMDTIISEVVYTTGEDPTQELAEHLRKIEETYLSWNMESSEIFQINACSGEEISISELMQEYLEAILQLAEDSKGAVDPTMGDIIRCWDIDGEHPQIPKKQELEALLKNSGWERIHLSENKLWLEEGTTLDLGAIGKGIGCDEIKRLLDEREDITGMILNLGGSSVYAYGEKPESSVWKVAVTDPRDTEGEYLGVIALNGGEFLSTSGDYEKYFMEDGIRYHHILDPENGYPVRNGLTAVKVVGKSGLETDALSTACFVLGIERSKELLEKYQVDALFVDEEQKIYLTEGMKERFELLKENYSIS